MINKPQLKTFPTLASITLETSGIIIALGALSFDLFSEDISSPRPGNMQLLGVLLGLSLILLAHFVAPYRPIRKTILSTKAPSFLIFSLSCILMIINIGGLFISLRNPAVYDGIGYAGKIRVPRYTSEGFSERMNRIEAIDEQYPAYVKRLTQLVFDSTVHYWENDENASAFNLKIPLHENYLLYFMNKLNGRDELYEFCRAEKAVERCATVCSQSSRILADVLTRNRVRAQIVALDGHVVVRARVDRESDEWWILDGDYGVLIEHDLQEIEQAPEIITSAYQEKGYHDLVIAEMVAIYGPNGNEIIDEKLLCEREEHLYLLKWWIPSIGMLTFLTYLPIHYWRFRNHKKS